MGARQWTKNLRKDQRGFTLPELLVTIAIMGILLAIAIIIWLGLLEQRRVDAAANQFAADMRLAHSKATNQLSEWRLILVPDRADQSAGADYYMVKPSSNECIQRFFPANVKIEDHNPALNDTPAIVPPTCPSPAPTVTRKIEFNSNGTLAFRLGPSGSICVTVDNDPKLRVTGIAATSATSIEDRSGESCAPPP